MAFSALHNQVLFPDISQNCNYSKFNSIITVFLLYYSYNKTNKFSVIGCIHAKCEREIQNIIFSNCFYTRLWYAACHNSTRISQFNLT